MQRPRLLMRRSLITIVRRMLLSMRQWRVGSILSMLTLLTLTMAIWSRDDLRNLIRHARVDRVDHVWLGSVLAVSIIRLAVLAHTIRIAKWYGGPNGLRIILRCLWLGAVLATRGPCLGSRSITIIFIIDIMSVHCIKWLGLL